MAALSKHTINEFIQSNHLCNNGDTLLLAISGGIDSVVLAHLLKSMGQSLELVHCNFSLRGAESYRDEAFVTKLAMDWQLPLHVQKFDTNAFAAENKLSIQLAARQLRYGYFESLRQQLSNAGKKVWIVTAHHANDSVETLLMNLFRGTGIDGLRGIPVRNGHIIRPLLFAYRSDIEAYAQQHQLSWVEDSSNEKEDYTRNYIRHTILPAIETQFPSVLQNVHESTFVFREVSALYHEAVDSRLKKLVVKEKEIEKIPVLKIQKMGEAETTVFEWIEPFGFSPGQVAEVLKLLHATNGSYVASATHRIIRNRAWLVLAPLAAPAAALQVADAWPYKLEMPGGKTLSIEEARSYQAHEGIPRLPPNEALLDASKIRLPLIIRPWKQGDYFYPLGMAKKKKVARFLIDQKLSPVEKETVWVVESNKRICWVVGYRIDDRFRISPQTKQVVRFSLG